MAFGFSMEIIGDYAQFSRPELKVERVSYDFISPSAARGIIEAVLWKPAIKYVIDRIYVINPIKFTNIRRNEVAVKASASLARAAMNGSDNPMYISSTAHIQQRASCLLRDVRYIVDAHFEMTDKAGESDTPEKYYNMILRRLRNGQFYHKPYLGCREFPAEVKLWQGEKPVSVHTGQRDFGFMLYDMDYSNPDNICPTFFRAVMQEGVIDLTDCEVHR